jgi:subtilisin family serine protease
MNHRKDTIVSFKNLAAFAAAALTLGLGNAGFAAESRGPNQGQDLLIKFANAQALKSFSTMAVKSSGGDKSSVETLGDSQWVHVKLSSQQLQTMDMEQLRRDPNVLYVQPNYKIHMVGDYQVHDPVMRARLNEIAHNRALGVFGAMPIDINAMATAMTAFANSPSPQPGPAPIVDNPPIPGAMSSGGTGPDPLASNQWGMIDNGVAQSWGQTRGAGIIVAVIDTGVDYTHEDLIDSLWRNPGETGMDANGKDKSNNGIDDDANGFIDDTIGWDFATNDNKPFDLSVDAMTILSGGGNPGHGTHCAGNIAAHADNGKGIAGVAPEAKIMAVRFMNEKGEGNTADAVKAINYAVKNGAKVLSNSWGSEGEDPSDAANNQALRDAITAAQTAGVLFVAAAGNGHSGVGYDNDSDPKPGVPASYPIDNIISVAAIDKNDALGSFSNWGAKTVHLAAPGVDIFSTMVGNRYSDLVVDVDGIQATWDGTSMACPHVAGAAALYWAKHPTATYQQVKAAILASAKPVPALAGKMVTGGKLNVQALMAQ